MDKIGSPKPFLSLVSDIRSPELIMVQGEDESDRPLIEYLTGSQSGQSFVTNLTEGDD